MGSRPSTSPTKPPTAASTFSFQPPLADAGDLRALLIQVRGGAVTGMALGPGTSRSGPANISFSVGSAMYTRRGSTFRNLAHADANLVVGVLVHLLGLVIDRRTDRDGRDDQNAVNWRTMRRAFQVPVVAVFFSLPTLLACGGESKPAANPTSESAPAASSEKSTSPDTAGPAASASSAPEAETTTPPAASAAPAPPPAPSLGSTDCGHCIDKTCAKPATACGKNGDCRLMMDGMHSCSSGAASCIDGAMIPSTAKPKKLATAYEACAKKAVAKACKVKCQ
jgi:hypothetical protein